MTDQNILIEVGNFKLKTSLLKEVIECMETALKRNVTNDEALKFLSDNQTILASIVGYDEVDTTDRHNIWDAIDDKIPSKYDFKNRIIIGSKRTGKSIFDKSETMENKRVCISGYVIHPKVKTVIYILMCITLIESMVSYFIGLPKYISLIFGVPGIFAALLLLIEISCIFQKVEK